MPGCFRFLPDLSIHLLFDLSGLIDVEPFLVASNDRYVDLAVPAGAQLVGLQFAVWDALWFREGPGLDRTTFAVSFDIHWAYTLYFTLLDVHNQGSAVAEVGQHVPPFSPWINRALQKGFSPYSSQIIRYAQSDLAPAYSDRHLRRLYQRLAGISPKKFYAILRFQHAAQRIYAERRLSWDGYSDQSHFTREFKALSGMTPAAFLRDYVP